MSQASGPLSRSQLALLLLVAGLIWFANLDYRRLFHPDEGRYAEIPREMLTTGDWISPRLNGIKYLDKPPLQYWITAAIYRAFGESEWTSRLWTALSGFLTVLLVYYAGTRLFSPEAALYGALILVSSVGFVVNGHYNTLDPGLTFFLTLALIGFVLAQHVRATPRESFVWMHVAWGAIALAVLSKGLVGAVLPAGALVCYALITRDFALWRRLHLVTGTLLFLVLGAPWFIAVSTANPEFARFFFLHEHFARFLTQVHFRNEPWWYFFVLLLAALLPWTTLLPGAIVRAWRNAAPSRAFHPGRFLIVYSGFVLFFFSISSSKLPPYILPMLPALALLMGEHAARLSPERLSAHFATGIVAGAVVLAVAVVLPTFASRSTPAELLAAFRPWLLASGGLLVVGSAVALIAERCGRRTVAILVASTAALLAGQAGISGADSLSPTRSGYHLVAHASPLLKPDTPFYSVAMYDQTLPFYLKRTMTLVGSAEEMSFGLEQEPHLWIHDFDAFERKWRDGTRALALMPSAYFDALAAKGLPMRVIARDPRRILVATP